MPVAPESPPVSPPPLPLRFRALRAFAVEADTDGTGVHVAAADDEHGVDAQLLRVLNLPFDRAVAEVGAHADLLAAEFGGDALRVGDKRGGGGIVFRADGDDAHLVGREPEGEVAGVMLDEETDDAFVRAERSLEAGNSPPGS